MRIFLLVISYLFHPLFVPMAGACCYFIVTPKYSAARLEQGTVLPIFILTVVIPIITYFILRNVGLADSVFLSSINKRKYPLFIQIILLLIVIYQIVPKLYAIELHFYFLGLVIAALSALLLVYLKVKASLHLMGMGGLFMFMVCLSIHFAINITLALSIFTLLTGLVATSRLYLKAHSKGEILIGFLLGCLAQLMLVRFWL